MNNKRQYNKIPTVLQEKEFNEFVLPHLKSGKRGPKKKLSFLKLFNYILHLMHTGCQWENIPIEKDLEGKKEIHYTNNSLRVCDLKFSEELLIKTKVA